MGRRFRGSLPAMLFALLASAAAIRPVGAESMWDARHRVSMELVTPINYGTFLPAQLRFANQGSERLLELNLHHTMSGSSTAAVTRLAMQLPPGKTRLELPLINILSGGKVDVTIRLDGRSVSDLSTSTWLGYSGYQSVIVALGERIGAVLPTIENRAVSVKLSVRDAPRLWQSYLGRKSIVVGASGDIAELDAAQKRALRRWVSYGGGRLWIVGDSDHDALSQLGLDPGSPSGPFEPNDADQIRSRPGEPDIPAFPPELAWRRAVTGHVALTSLEVFRRVESEQLVLLTKTLSRTSRYFDSYEFNNDELSSSLFSKLHEIPRLGYSLLTILLGLLIGPLNLLILKRKNRLALFYVTAPLLALGGMLALVVFTFSSDGVHLKMNETALLLHELQRDEGVLYRARGVFGPFPPQGGIPLTTDTAAMPFFSAVGQRTRARLESDWTSAQTLRDGWIRSRELSGLTTAAPRRVRVGLRPVARGPGDVRVVSELKGPAREVWVRLSGKRYFAESVSPGQEVRLAPTDRYPAAFGIPFVALNDLDWTVMARTDWLPGLENGSVMGEVLSKEYFYVGVAPPPADMPGKEGGDE